MPNRGFETPARRGLRGGREPQRRARLLPGRRRQPDRLAGPHPAAVVHPLSGLPAHDQGPPARRRGGRAGEPEHHRGRARPLRLPMSIMRLPSTTDTSERSPMTADATTDADPERGAPGEDPGALPRYPSKRAVTLPALHLVQEHLRCVPVPGDGRDRRAAGDHAGRGPRHDELLRLLPAGAASATSGSGSAGRSRACSAAATSCSSTPASGSAIEPGETTADGKLTVEFAECLGICDFAPAALADDGRVFGPLDEESVDAMLDELKRDAEESRRRDIDRRSDRSTRSMTEMTDRGHL